MKRKQGSYQYDYWVYGILDTPSKKIKSRKYYDIFEEDEFQLVGDIDVETWIYFSFKRNIGNYQSLPEKYQYVRRLDGDEVTWEFQDDHSGATIWSGLDTREVENIAILEKFYQNWKNEKK